MLLVGLLMKYGIDFYSSKTVFLTKMIATTSFTRPATHSDVISGDFSQRGVGRVSGFVNKLYNNFLTS